MLKYKSSGILLAVLMAAGTLSAQTIIFTDDFTGTTPFVQGNTVVTPETWYGNNTGRFGLDDASDSARRSTSSPGAYTSIAYAGASGAGSQLTQDVTLSFDYSNTLVEADIVLGLYGATGSNDGFGGGSVRLRTDDGGTDGAGTEWERIAFDTTTITNASGTISLSWTHTGTDYNNFGIVIATTDITGSSGNFLDVNSVTLATTIPEPSTYAVFLGLVGLGCMLIYKRRR